MRRKILPTLITLLTCSLCGVAAPLPSTDSAKYAVAYYEKHGTADERMQAYYNLACTYRNRHDSPRAVTNFLKAANLAERGESTDTALWMRCCSQLCYLYGAQFNYEESLHTALQGYRLAQQSGRLSAWYMMDVASAYFLLEDTVRGMPYADRAYEEIVDKRSSVQNVSILSEMLPIYSVRNQWRRADSIATMLRAIPTRLRPNDYDLTMGIYFRLRGQQDSAIAHLRKTFDDDPSMTRKSNAAALLMQLYDMQGDTLLALRYARAFMRTNDSVMVERQFEQTANARGQFLYERDREREDMLMHRSERLKQAIMLGSLGFAILLLLGCVYHYRRKKKLLEDIIAKERIIRETEEALQTRTAQNRELMRHALMDHATTNAETTIRQFRKASEGRCTLTQDDWKRLFAAVDAMYPDFKDNVQERIKRLSEPTLRTCYLLKIGMTNPQIENLMDVPHQTVWYRVRKIEDAMGDCLGL